jgi:MarR family 2-MHQ and catechol resistance regulon transcriptional repressor
MGTHYQGTKKEVSSLNTYIKLIRSAETLTSKINLELDNFNLTESQFGVLDVLLHLGPLKQKELAKKILKSGGNITMVIDNLEKEGFVQRKRGEKDRRHFMIHLTVKGKNKIQTVFPKFLKTITKYFEILNKNEQKELQKLCKITGLQIRK